MPFFNIGNSIYIDKTVKQIQQHTTSNYKEHLFYEDINQYVYRKIASFISSEKNIHRLPDKIKYLFVTSLPIFQNNKNENISKELIKSLIENKPIQTKILKLKK